jgi:hypothetical protein
MKAPATTTAAAPAASSTAMTAKPAASSSMAMTAKPAASGSSSMSMQAAGGKAKCKDGTVVSYKSRSGTCSGHHGVATWM